MSTLQRQVEIGEALPDIAFYNAVLRIWLGTTLVQSDLKRGLFGEKWATAGPRVRRFVASRCR